MKNNFFSPGDWIVVVNNIVHAKVIWQANDFGQFDDHVFLRHATPVDYRLCQLHKGDAFIPAPNKCDLNAMALWAPEDEKDTRIPLSCAGWPEYSVRAREGKTWVARHEFGVIITGDPRQVLVHAHMDEILKVLAETKTKSAKRLLAKLNLA